MQCIQMTMVESVFGVKLMLYLRLYYGFVRLLFIGDQLRSRVNRHAFFSQALAEPLVHKGRSEPAPPGTGGIPLFVYRKGRPPCRPGRFCKSLSSRSNE